MYFKHIVEVDNFYKNIRNANGVDREVEPCKNRLTEHTTEIYR